LEAQDELNELPEPYNIDDPWNDAVFARIEDPGTDCFFTIVLPLKVLFSLDIEDLSLYILCESDFGSGTAVFDLPGKEGEILGTADPDLFDIYYYEDLDEAMDAGVAALTDPDFSRAIGNPGAYINQSNPQTIYVLVVGNGNYTDPFNGGEGCYAIVELELIVEGLQIGRAHV